MLTYIVTFKPDCSDAEMQKAKQGIIDAGGKITNEYSLIRGFSCEVPEVHMMTFQNNPYVENVEQDMEVTIQ
ncbi:peptidase inhibitor I9 [Pyronema domesticum]|uniref:Similar to Protease B inhibitors 2 and 1 acc. no. P01095 n=1 Tax=Pyronema omphalodes (strain CBS 100304) TaxID=1076935 RepID=U4LV48_PYROM|nr:peptidase inhibitor I9 [Pyronema domesticum]CCX34272.1 Similar to Protease B inhibitors 2 and 1; acc. no. P01095 [Pyronema omphalodes CBS 100304]